MSVRFTYIPNVNIKYSSTAIISPNCIHHIIFDLNGTLHTGLAHWDVISGTISVSLVTDIFISVISPIAHFYNPL